MIQVQKELLLIGTTTNSILTADLSPPPNRNPLDQVEINEIPLTQVFLSFILLIKKTTLSAIHV